jgi:chromosome segregation ATPase
METAEAREGLAMLGGVRERLLSELVKLSDKRKDLEAQRLRLEAQLKPLKKELKEVVLEVEAAQRMLALVEATEQQLAGQGKGGANESGPDHSSAEASTEVRGGPRQNQPFCP